MASLRQALRQIPRLAVARPALRQAAAAFLALQTGNGAGEILRIERLQIVEALADADGAHRQA